MCSVLFFVCFLVKEVKVKQLSPPQKNQGSDPAAAAAAATAAVQAAVPDFSPPKPRLLQIVDPSSAWAFGDMSSWLPIVGRSSSQWTCKWLVINPNL